MLAAKTSRLATMALVAVGCCRSSIEPAEQANPADVAPRALVRAGAGCGGPAGSCAAAYVRSDQPLLLGVVLADPSVKSFVGLADYAWDFNAPQRIPGFGFLSAEEATRIVALMTTWQASAPFDVSAPLASLRSVRTTEDVDTATLLPTNAANRFAAVACQPRRVASQCPAQPFGDLQVPPPVEWDSRPTPFAR